METVAVSEFRANLVSFLKKVENGATITLTSRGHEVAKIIPPENKVENARKALEELQKTSVLKDVLSPIGDMWEAQR